MSYCLAGNKTLVRLWRIKYTIPSEDSGSNACYPGWDQEWGKEAMVGFLKTYVSIGLIDISTCL